MSSFSAPEECDTTFRQSYNLFIDLSDLKGSKQMLDTKEKKKRTSNPVVMQTYIRSKIFINIFISYSLSTKKQIFFSFFGKDHFLCHIYTSQCYRSDQPFFPYPNTPLEKKRFFWLTGTNVISWESRRRIYRYDLIRARRDAASLG